MAVDYLIHSKFLNHKLEFLDQIRSHLNAVVDDYISEVARSGKVWIECKGDQSTFSKICLEIDDSVAYLSSKCREISDNTELHRARAQSAAESTLQERQNLLESEIRQQPSSSAVQILPSPAAVQILPQQTHFLESGPDTDLLHQVLPRVGSTEEAICSIHNKMEKVTEQQADMDKKFEDIAAKLLNINKQLSDLSAADKQQNKKLKEHTDIVTEKQDEIQKQQESRFKSLEKIVKKLSTKQDKLEKEKCSRVDMNEELERKISDSSELVQCKISDLEAQLEETDSSVTDLLNRVGLQEQVTQSLCTKVDTNIDTLETVSLRQDINAQMLREFEDKLQVTETRVREELEKLGEQYQETETSLKTMCQLLVNRLEPLEQLRSVLNQRGRAQDDNVRQLQEMRKEVAAMATKITQLETKFSKSSVGFSTRARLPANITACSVITCYDSTIRCDSEHFSHRTGVFTAPVAGTFVACVRVNKLEDKEGELRVRVTCRKTKPCNSDTKFVCWAVSAVKNVSACDLGLVQLEAGDTLHAEVIENSCNVESWLTFSCFMIR